MKLSVFTVLFSEKTFEEMLDYVSSKGIEAIEVGTGGFPGDAHCKVDELLESEEKQKEYLEAVHQRGVTISALSCHGNPLHPQKHIAQRDDELFNKTVLLASKLGVPVVNTFSGCPGDHEDAKHPNWPVAPWLQNFKKY